MRHDPKLKERVRNLRRKGLSLNQIFNDANIPKTTIRSWIKDISLTEKQKAALKENTQLKLQEGRIKSQLIQKQNRIKKEIYLTDKGINEVKNITHQEFLIAGIALYWAEGFKNMHEHRLGFCNSDPEMIKFYLKWLYDCLGLKKGDVVLRMTLNESYRDKEKEIKKYWAEVTKISEIQFTKTFYQKTKWKKQYSNQDYHGVLRIHVKESLDNLILMRGWIEGLKMNV